MSRRRHATLAAAIALACSTALPGSAQEGKRGGAGPDPRIYEDAWRMIRDAFYDRGMHGVDWEAAKGRHLERARNARTQEEVHEAILDLMAELKASHTAVIEPDVYIKHYDHEAKSIPAPTFGLKIARLEDGWFVADAVRGGPARAAGVLRGDRLLAVKGAPPEEAGLRPLPWDAGLGGTRYYILPCNAPGETTRLELQRFPRPKGLYQVDLTSALWSELEACRVSRAVVERSGVKVAYMRLYHLLSEEPVLMLEEWMSEELQDCHAFVLDIRGQGGLPNAVDRTVDLFDPNVRGGPLWGNRPAVLLVDDETRSAKEIMAFYWKRRGVGPVVGMTTRGAVLGAQFRQMNDGAWLLLPILDMRTMTGGVVLEGKGVDPDIEVEPRLAWAQGRDPIFERGLEQAVDEALALRRAGKRQGWY